MHNCLLFVPGDRPERFARATASGADAVVIDLEDAVQPDAKSAARAHVAEWLAAGGKAIVRINAISTDWHEADLAILNSPGLLAVMLPMAEDPDSLSRFTSGLPDGLPVIALIETALGLWNLGDLVKVDGISRLGFGSIDFQLDTGVEDENQGLLFARSRIVVASAMAGLEPPLDGVTVNLDDETVLASDTARARRLGFGGKLCIDPGQVEGVKSGFMPSTEEIEQAQRIKAVAEEAGAKGAIRLDGRLIDAPVVARALRLLEGLE